MQLALDRLNVTGSVLMIGAHPDDENTAVLAYFARGRNLRTGYLSLTRGEGGQNLIGSEQGDELGLIRTEELLAARRIDGAEQFFTRAIDFGFTKTPQETFEKWGREKILGDVVWVVRRFRPDVIVLRFSGTPRDGHGQHQASAILGKEAFTAAGDPKRFPEQLKYVQAWQAKRLMWNAFSFNRDQEKELEKIPNKIEIDPGQYDPLLGYSFGEIAGMSRTQHKSQGMGSPERKGTEKNWMINVAGDPATKGVFDGIDISWDSVPGAAELSRVLAEAARTFQPAHPEKSVPLLLKAKTLMAALHQPVVERKQKELDEAIALTSGLWVDAAADKYASTPGGSFKITRTAINRSGLSIELDGKALPDNDPVTSTETRTIANEEPYSQPYWLREPKDGAVYSVSNQLLIGLPENPPLLESKFIVRFGTQTVEFVRPVVFRYIDRVLGQLTRPLIVEPAVAVEPPVRPRVFPNGQSQPIEVQVKANVSNAAGTLSLNLPEGWHAEPMSQNFQLSQPEEQVTLKFHVTPPSHDGQGQLKATAKIGDRTIGVGMEVISYPHIPPQALFPRADTGLVRADIRNFAKTIGYVMGAGDDVPESLRQIGADVILLTADELGRADLNRFDAIVTGVRAYNTRPDLRANEGRLLEYVSNGGTVVVQYNVPEGGGPQRTGDPTLLAHIGPYPLTTGGQRVTVEEVPVQFPNPANPILHRPNEITERDFEGWVQERGLYFASEWDPHYQPLFEMHDPGEKSLLGGTLYTKYGKGVYIFTPLVWFRELPAGVPGAYRIFANMISASKAETN